MRERLEKLVASMHKTQCTWVITEDQQHKISKAERGLVNSV